MSTKTTVLFINTIENKRPEQDVTKISKNHLHTHICQSIGQILLLLYYSNTRAQLLLFTSHLQKSVVTDDLHNKNLQTSTCKKSHLYMF